MKALAYAFPFLFLSGCSNPDPTKNNHSKLIGRYEGPFGDAPITLAITSVSDSAAFGFSRHLDVERPLTGQFTFDGTNYRMKLVEPGDHPFDGTFLLRVDDGCKKITGFWFPKNLQNRTYVSLKLKRKS
jgi:hypothetical protein